MKIQISDKYQALLLPTRSDLHLLFPQAGILDSHLVVPYDARTAVVLQRLGHPIPNPMLRYYDWPGEQPFHAQKITCALLSANPRAYVLNDMGTGKTRSALWAWDYLNRTGCAGRLLVVAKLSSLNFTWVSELRKVMPWHSWAVLHGSKRKRLEQLARDVDVYVINHDGVKTIAEELAARTDIDTLVLDESAVYRNYSQRMKLMRTFAQRFSWVWAMTGSPMPQEPTDVWGQAAIVTPERVPRYRNRCRDQLMFKVDQYTWVPKPDAVERAFAMLQPSVRFALDDVVELPPAIERPIEVELSDTQQKVYARMHSEFMAMIEEKVITAANAGVAMNKLVQVAGGWVYTIAPEYMTLDNSPRVQALLDLIDEAQHKIIIWCPYRHAIEELYKIVSKHLFPHGMNSAAGVGMIHGDIDTKARELVFDAFQNGSDMRVLLAHPITAGHSVTLTAADTAIWWTPPYGSYEIFEQANARIRRAGQKHKQHFLFMQGSPVERRLYKLLRGKQKMQDAYLDLVRNATEEIELT